MHINLLSFWSYMYAMRNIISIQILSESIK